MASGQMGGLNRPGAKQFEPDYPYVSKRCVHQNPL